MLALRYQDGNCPLDIAGERRSRCRQRPAGPYCSGAEKEGADDG
jgi:hypothetical protein